jgi:dTDP-4-amino-4,6-dideoxygalactose transaminase
MSFDKILQFETALAEFTGAPYAIMTDCCTHALELCFRYDRVEFCAFTPFTYLSIPMLMHKLGINFAYETDGTQWVGEYRFRKTRIWDSARLLQRNMYQPGQIQCLSFGHGKPLHIGRGGAILLDDAEAYQTILQQRYDGRDLTVTPWESQKTFKVGYHYKPTIEEAEQGLALLEGVKELNPEPKFVAYPDLRQITIIS